MTKRDAASTTYWIAKLIRDTMGDDEDANVWVLLLEGVARNLDPDRARDYSVLWASKPSKQRLLRNLIEHPDTPSHERDAAVLALHRLRTGQ
jgi:hypothetical protein